MTEQKNAPTRIWACLEGPMVGMFVSGGYTADWPKYIRADVADEMLEALKMVLQHGRIDNSEDRMNVVSAAIAKAEGRS